MKKASIYLALTIALVSGAWAQGDYSVNQITVSTPNTPQIAYSGGAPIKASTPQSWLESEVEFKSAVDFTDELTFKYYIYLETGKAGSGKCLVGTVAHTNIPKGTRLYSVMYVSPRSLEHFAGGKFNSSMVQEVTIQILNKGQVIAQKSLKNTQGEWWTRCEQVQGVLLNKNQTPFSSIYWDHFVEIKPSAN